MNVVVVGAGTMGPGIAQVFAMGGYDVTLTDIRDDILQRAIQRIRESLEAFVRHGVLDKNAADNAFLRITYSTDNIEAAKKCDFMIEAVPENLQLKRQIFSLYEEYSKNNTILASNTSGIPIKDIAEAVKRKERVLGVHFYNPAHLNTVVEIIRTEYTTDEFVDKAKQILIACNKKPVVVVDIPGFLHNRLIYALLREAVSLVEQGLTTIEDVDTVVREAFGPRFSILGLFKLVDIVGLDIYYNVSSYLNKYLSTNSAASNWIKAKIDNGELGMKGGRGFYEWDEETKKTTMATLNAEMIRLIKNLKNYR